MVNQEYRDRLRHGVEEWNRWRKQNPRVRVDFSGSNLSFANLCFADLSFTDLSFADLRYANLAGADLAYTDLTHAYLSDAYLIDADLSFADLYDANLHKANLHKANLSDANLTDANFIGVDLSDANLSAVKALGTNFHVATLTGICIENWNINSQTNLQEVTCEYIFTKHDYKQCQFTDRRPHDLNQIFAPGEFTKRYQIVLESVELFFNDGIDWKAFLTSLEDLKVQYGDELNIQGIEKKAGGSLVVRLEVPSDADKGVVEQQAKELYKSKLQLLEAHYQERFQLQGEQLSFFRKQVEIERISNARLERIIETMVEKESSKYDLRGAKFAGGFAAEGGTQMGGTFNDFSQTVEQNKTDIDTLIQALRGMAEAFPTEKRHEANVYLDNLENDLQHPEKRKPNRIKARLSALLAIAVGVGGAVATATDFTNNVLELSKKLEIPIEQVEPQSQQKDAIDVKAIDLD